jgi:hypothetical protein
MKRKFYTLAFSLTLAQFLMAQAPGGVSTNLTMWMKTTSGTTVAGGLLTAWTYANDGTKSFTATVAPTFTTNAINFNPAAVFTTTQYMDGPTGANAPITAGNDTYTAFVVWNSSVGNNYQRLWEQRSTCNTCSDAFSVATWNDGHYGVENATSPFQYTLTQPYTINTWHISQLNLKNTALGDLEIVDETNYVTPLVINSDFNNINGPAARSIANTVNRIGINHDLTTGLTGSIAEIIVYNSNIDAGASRDKIFSYLALKYGVNLNHDLTASGGATPWSTTTNTGYNNRVFGIGNDVASNLLISQSNSVATGNGDGTGISGAGNVTLANPSLNTDQSFLFVGDDNGALTESTTGAPTTPSGFSILARKWKAQHTGNVGTVDVKFDYTGLPHQGTLGDPNSFRMFVDATGAGDFQATTPTAYAPASFAGSIVTYSGVTLPTGAVFTFGSTATPLPVVWRSFTASLTGKNDITLNWVIDENQNAKVYEVEHSLDGTHFSKIGEIANETDTKAYSFAYPSATAGTHYFRVHEVDIDGKFIYSKIVSVLVKTSDYSLRLLSNPVNTSAVEMEVVSATSAKATISLLSSSGNRLLTSQQQVQPGSNRYQLPIGNVAAGNYILQVRIGSAVLHEKVIKL